MRTKALQRPAVDGPIELMGCLSKWCPSRAPFNLKALDEIRILQSATLVLQHLHSSFVITRKIIGPVPAAVSTFRKLSCIVNRPRRDDLNCKLGLEDVQMQCNKAG